MTTVMVGPHDGDWTVDDLDGLPNDGRRYELFDGVLVVSPAPVKSHQRAVGSLYTALRAACPAELEVFFAPLDYQPTRRRSFQPDVLVVPRDDPGEKAITGPPVLVVEVTSPSTRSKDLVQKRDLYQSSGVAHYWLVDPADATFLAYELVDGGYRLVATAEGTQTVELTRPFPVAVCPADLIAGR